MRGLAEQIDSIESVSDQAGQRSFVVTATNGERYRIREDQLRWVWRPVFTSLGLGRRVRGLVALPITLVIAEKASAVRVACERCGRSQSASLFRTRQNEVEDLYFTRCHRCWRSRFLGRFSRVHVDPSLAPARPVVGPAGTLSTKAKFLVGLVLIGLIFGCVLLLVNLPGNGVPVHP